MFITADYTDMPGFKWQEQVGKTASQLNKVLNGDPKKIQYKELSQRSGFNFIMLAIILGGGFGLAYAFIGPPAFHVAEVGTIRTIDVVYFSIGSGIAVGTLLIGSKYVGKLHDHYNKKLTSGDLAKMESEVEQEIDRAQKDADSNAKWAEKMLPKYKESAEKLSRILEQIRKK